ncbi:hypothetical protein ACA910_001683 [Epithemia clementina (nom. ined.)]
MIEEVRVFRDNSKILCSENPKVPSTASANNTDSIHFSLECCTQTVLSEYSAKITHDPEIRGLDSSSGLKEKQERLKSRLKEEWLYVKLKLDNEMSKEKAVKAMFLLMNAVPCILHAENWMGIKVLSMLLIEGLSNAIRLSKTGEKKAAVCFLQRVERIMMKIFFGDYDNEAQWQCPVSDDKKE